MEQVRTFTLGQHGGPYESWPLESELLAGTGPTGKRIPGYVLEAQYRHGTNFLFVTSWDCPFEESLEVVLTDDSLKVLDRRSIGAMYTSTWLERHEVVADNQLLLHCDNGFQVRVTVLSCLQLDLST